MPSASHKKVLSRIFCAFLMILACELSSEVSHFQVVKSEKNGANSNYSLHTLKGSERMNYGFNRLSMLSENQAHYPTPESGCGPTAMLNILIWYEKFGLIPPLYRDANPLDYKSKLFNEIDRRLVEQSGTTRTQNLGVKNLDTAIVMDLIVSQRTKGTVRIHTDFIKAPLKLGDFFETTKNFRSGYLIVKPKDLETDQFLDDHVAAIVHADRTGYITLATWGNYYRGRLQKRYDGQWFVSQDAVQIELKVKALTRFIPFRPI